jgi:hypothetical protein
MVARVVLVNKGKMKQILFILLCSFNFLHAQSHSSAISNNDAGYSVRLISDDSPNIVVSNDWRINRCYRTVACTTTRWCILMIVLGGAVGPLLKLITGPCL